jgi:ABC-type transport system substrate-binding protein
MLLVRERRGTSREELVSDAVLGRRTFLKGAMGAAALAAGGGLLSACSSGSSTSSATSSSAGAFSGTPKRGGTLRFATWSEIDGMDPSFSRWDQTGYAYARTVYDPLAVYDTNGKVVPYLLRSITPTPDFTHWTLGLRPNVTFHDGAPLDAAALVTFFEKMITSPLTGFAYTPVATVSPADPMTVSVGLKQPWPSFSAYLADGQLAYPPSPNFWNNPKRALQPVGTGPFVFKEWVQNDHFTATSNPRYWRKGLPYLDTITFRPIIDTTSEENTLKANNVDAMFGGSTQQIVDFRDNPDYFYFDDSNPSVNTYNPVISFLMVNTAKPPLDDVRLRRAMAAAIDQKKLIALTYNGVGSPINGPFPPNSAYYEPNTGYPSYNPTMARQLADQVKHDRGNFTINLATVPNPTDVATIQAVQAMWRQVGIDSQLGQVEQAQFITNALMGNYDVYTFLLFGGLDFDEQYVWLNGANALPVGQLALNFTRFKDPQLQAALDQARVSPDLATRAASYRTVASRLGAGCPYLWVTRVYATTISHKTVHNLAGLTSPEGVAAFRAGGAIYPVEMWTG